MICHSTDSTFKNDLRREGLTLVNFWAAWCSPCRMLGSVLEDYDAVRREDVRIVKINVDENEETMSYFGVMSLPTMILFKHGQPIDKKIGYMSKEALAEWVSVNL